MLGQFPSIHSLAQHSVAPVQYCGSLKERRQINETGHPFAQFCLHAPESQKAPQVKDLDLNDIRTFVGCGKGAAATDFYSEPGFDPS